MEEISSGKGEEDSVSLSFYSSTFSYLYTKHIRLEGNKIIYSYAVEKKGTDPFPCIWTFHCLVKYTEDMQIIYPAGTKCFTNVLKNKKLGNEGQEYSYQECSTYNFNTVPDSAAMCMVKYYSKDKVKEGKCGYRYPAEGMQCRITYNEQELPYLGFFVTAGGFRGDYNCALEPSDGYYDSVSRALENHSCRVMHTGDKIQFAINIELTED